MLIVPSTNSYSNLPSYNRKYLRTYLQIGNFIRPPRPIHEKLYSKFTL